MRKNRITKRMAREIFKTAMLLLEIISIMKKRTEMFGEYRLNCLIR